MLCPFCSGHACQELDPLNLMEHSKDDETRTLEVVVFGEGPPLACMGSAGAKKLEKHKSKKQEPAKQEQAQSGSGYEASSEDEQALKEKGNGKEQVLKD